MKSTVLFALAVSVAVAALNSKSLLTNAVAPGDVVAREANNAAFRDGLHLGKFDAASGRTRHLSVGRWSSDANRTSFIAGYQTGYEQMNATQAAEE
jgi:hypothetical protein